MKDGRRDAEMSEEEYGMELGADSIPSIEIKLIKHGYGEKLVESLNGKAVRFHY